MWVTFKVLLVLFYELGEMNILLHSFIILVSYYLKLTIIVDPISELFLVLTDLGGLMTVGIDLSVSPWAARSKDSSLLFLN